MTKRVIVIALALSALFALIICLAQPAPAQGPELPPKAEGEVHVIFPPGYCSGLIEVGWYKHELSAERGFDIFWTQRPRVFVEPCELVALPTVKAQYRLAVRCVKRDEERSVKSSWIRSMSGEKKPWPELGPDQTGNLGCLGWAPGRPINPELCPQ